MRDAYRSLLTALGAVLALWLILGFWPLSSGSRVALSLLIVLVSGVMLWRQRRASQARATAVREIVDENLPPEDFQGAVILVCGDNSPLFVSGSHNRETRQGWYLWVKDAEQLPLLAQHLSLVRPAQVSQLSVMLAVVPEQHTSGDDFTQHLRGWQRAVVRCRAAFGTIPPLWTVTWVSPPVACAEAEPVWFTTVSPRSGIQVYQPGQGNVSLTDWPLEIGTDGRLSRLSHGLWLDSLLAWQNSAVNDLLSLRRGELPVMTPCVQGMCIVPVSGIAGNLWQQHITSLTALPPDAFVSTEPLPELLLPALPRRCGVSRRMVFWRYAGLLGGIFLALAMLASWMNNQRLIRNVGDHLALYHQLTGQPVAPKLRAQQRLRADGALLDDWQRRGEPLRYRLGLYQGLRLIPPVEAAVSDWAPPPPPPPVIKKIIQGPKTIRLDSMSLFDSGKFVLKAGSTKMLVNSLVGIKAKLGWLIVVSGHTDNTGNPQLNQMLSLKRAEAVRNWMRDTGDVPESCFAVQGYGESRPAATNDTPEGRALNRRVEISLVPQANACQLPGKHPAPSQDDGASQLNGE
ncbi:OmpA family protein [Enterobacter kobei]|uniref:OmpA family protein n=1 Tax=Enterobacter kobei TaxID=208224 RepID=UPI001258F70D|nr:OmpA family protein [Enterobacter kobei]ELC0996017.1 OmpA family protein [Enterobacter kobei]ELE9741577.1 OmpA family protein [Enterobacter kobei]MDE7916179.1 OmpA family protein [Enterobacter kobei]VAX68263.1 putative type VI secretion protein [Enterobacter kobei]HDC4554201.1 OmpA family protein [Enterobacter kobei]